jgi:hypothetical protein
MGRALKSRWPEFYQRGTGLSVDDAVRLVKHQLFHLLVGVFAAWHIEQHHHDDPYDKENNDILPF